MMGRRMRSQVSRVLGVCAVSSAVFSNDMVHSWERRLTSTQVFIACFLCIYIITVDSQCM